MSKPTIPLVVGRGGMSGFPFYLEFQPSTWKALTDDLANAIGILTAYRNALLAGGPSHLLGEPQENADAES